jgi:hypothetical protein
MSDLAPSPESPADSDVVSSATETSRPPSPTKPAPQPNRAQTYPTAETAPVLRLRESYLAGDTNAEKAKRWHNAGHLARVWRHARLQALAVVAAAMVGLAFGRAVAGNDYQMQIFFAATVGMGLFFVFSALATQLTRNRRNARRH